MQELAAFGTVLLAAAWLLQRYRTRERRDGCRACSHAIKPATSNDGRVRLPVITR
jgi:hypothetical protein